MRKIIGLLFMLLAFSGTSWSEVNRVINIQEWKDPDVGTRVLFVPSTHLPMLNVSVVFNTGSKHDNKYGISYLSSQLVNENHELMDELENVGSILSASVDRDATIINLTTLASEEFAQQQHRALQLLIEAATTSHISADEFQRIQAYVLTQIDNNLVNPSYWLNRLMIETIFKDTPYAHTLMGDTKDIENISSNDVLDFISTHWLANNATVIMVGHLTEQQAKEISSTIIKGIFKDTNDENAVTDNMYVSEESTNSDIDNTDGLSFAPRMFKELTGVNQVHINIATTSIPRTDPDYTTLFLANHIFGRGGFGTRLMTEIREKQGLTYGIYSTLYSLKDAGMFTIQMQTDVANKDKAMSEIKRLLIDFIEEGVTEEELKNAKNAIRGSIPLGFTSNSEITDQLQLLAIHNLGVDTFDTFLQEVNSVSVAQIHQKLKKHFNNTWYTVEVGDILSN